MASARPERPYDVPSLCTGEASAASVSLHLDRLSTSMGHLMVAMIGRGWARRRSRTLLCSAWLERRFSAAWSFAVAQRWVSGLEVEAERVVGVHLAVRAASDDRGDERVAAAKSIHGVDRRGLEAQESLGVGLIRLAQALKGLQVALVELAKAAGLILESRRLAKSRVHGTDVAVAGALSAGSSVGMRREGHGL